jgi:tetratricopeptide (TPR) repeat protein
MRLSREQILFLVVLVIAGLWAWLSVTGGPDAKSLRLPQENPDLYKVPDVALVPLTEGIGAMPTASKGALRTGIFEEPVDVERPPPLDLETPPLLDLAIVMPPPSPRPGWSHLASLRRILTDVEAGAVAGEGEIPGADEEVGEVEEEAEEDLPVAAGFERREIPEEDWPYVYDRLTYTSGAKAYGRLNVPVSPARPHGKFSALVDDQPFMFTIVDPKRDRVIGSGEQNRDAVANIELAKTVENFHGIRIRDVPEQEPGRYDALMKLGGELVEKEWRDEDETQEALGKAAETYRLALETLPDDVPAILALSDCLRRRGEWDENLALLEDAVAKVEEPQVRVVLGETYVTLDLPVMAEDVYREASAANVGHSGLKRRLADLLFERGDLDGAGELYGSMIRFDAGTEDRVAAYLGAGAIALRRGRWEDALQAVSDAERIAEGATARSKTLEAAILIMKNDWEGAATAAAAALEMEPLSVDATRNHGLALALGGKLAEAKEVFRKARDADPFLFGTSNLGLGLVAHLEGRYGESVERYEQASAAMPGDPWLHYILGVSYRRDVREGHLDQARDRLLKALRIAPQFDDVLRQLGLVHQSREEWGPSASYLRRAVEIAPRDPQEPRAIEDLVKLLYVRAGSIIRDESRPKRERLLEAKALYERILEIRPDDLRGHNGRGYVLYMLDPEQTEDARGELDRVVNLTQGDSENEQGKYAEQRLEEIVDHDSKVIWRDRFLSSEVGPRWVTHPEGWVLSRTENGRLHLEVKKQGGEQAMFFQWLRQSQFGKLEELTFSLRIDAREDVTAGVFISKRRKGRPQPVGEIAVGRSFKGELAMRIIKPKMPEDPTWKPIEGQVWPADQPVRITIRRATKDVRKGLFDVLVNDVPVATDVDVSQLANRNDLIAIGVIAKAGRIGGAWKLQIDEMSMLLKRGGR